jgi:hypothetical protein
MERSHGIGVRVPEWVQQAGAWRLDSGHGSPVDLRFKTMATFLMILEVIRPKKLSHFRVMHPLKMSIPTTVSLRDESDGRNPQTIAILIMLTDAYIAIY